MGKATSIVVDDMEHCYICGSTQVQVHHIFGGPDRDAADKYHLVIALCRKHHTDAPMGVHHNTELMKALHRKGQQAFESHYRDLNFSEIFRKNYL